MKVNGLTFYPIHINVMKFSNPMHHLMTSHGHMLLSFLPVQLVHVHEHTYGEGKNLDLLLKPKNIHHCIMQAMKSLVDKALYSFQTGTSGHERFMLHVVNRT